MENHLASLMRQLQITGKELAVSLHVDVTLVSKYKNGKRRIGKELADDIATYMVRGYCKEYSLYFKIMKEILEPYSEKSIEAYDEEGLISLLKNYILEDQYEKKEKSIGKNGMRDISMQVAEGNEGWKKLLQQFIHFLSERENEEEKTSVLVGEFVFFDYGKPENYELYSYVNRVYMDMINAGHKVDIVTTVREGYQSYESIIKWAQLYARDKMTVYYLDYNSLWDYSTSIIVEKKEQALINLDKHRFRQDDVYLRIEDKGVVDYYTNILEEMRTRAHLLLTKIKIHQQGKIHQYLDNRNAREKIIYMLDSMPTYRNMPMDLLEEVLNANHIDGMLKSTILDSYHWWQEFYHKNNCHCIYDMEEIRRSIESDYYVDYELSAFIGRTISLNGVTLKRHIRFLLFDNPWNRNQTAFYSFSRLKLAYHYITMIVQEHNMLIMWSLANCKNCLLYNVPSFMEGCNQYLKNLWNGLPERNKEKDLFWEKVIS